MEMWASGVGAGGSTGRGRLPGVGSAVPGSGRG